MEKYYSRKDLSELLELKETTIKSYIKKGAPKSIQGKGYLLVDFLEWITERPQFQKKKPKVLKIALKTLKNIEKSPKKAKKTTLKKKYKSGAMAALERARSEEVEAYEAYKLKQSEKRGVANARATWQNSLDVLRKCENDLVKVLELQNELIPYKKYLSELEPKLLNFKTILLNIPSKLSPRLENLPWHEIQKLLDVEIRDALKAIQKSIE